MKYILYNKDNEEGKKHFNNCLKTIKQINDLKKDVIYNSCFPRLKECKYRGIQAFKKLIKKHYEKDNNKKFVFNESNKIFWLKMYKIVYKHNAYTFEINGNNCIILKNLNNDEIKKYLLLNDIEILDKEPEKYEKENKKDYIKIMANMIKDEGFNKNDCIELFKLIFDSQEH